MKLDCGLCESKLDEKDAKTLTCFHTFCAYCLKNYIQREEDEKLKAKCPECHADIILPANVNVDAGGGLNGLKCHPFVQRLLEEEKIDVNANPNGGICEFCDRNQATSLCSACNQIICDDCQKGHKKIKDHWKP